MPHAELKYSSDLTIDAPGMLSSIEETILSHDAQSGECKGRAYPADIYHRTHLSVSVALLRKPHRDEQFMQALLADLEQVLKRQLTQTCFFSLSLEFSGDCYVTNVHQVDA